MTAVNNNIQMTFISMWDVCRQIYSLYEICEIIQQ